VAVPCSVLKPGLKRLANVISREGGGGEVGGAWRGREAGRRCS